MREMRAERFVERTSRRSHELGDNVRGGVWLKRGRGVNHLNSDQSGWIWRAEFIACKPTKIRADLPLQSGITLEIMAGVWNIPDGSSP